MMKIALFTAFGNYSENTTPHGGVGNFVFSFPVRKFRDSATTIKIPLLPVVITQVSRDIVICDWYGTAGVRTIKTNRTGLTQFKKLTSYLSYT